MKIIKKFFPIGLIVLPFMASAQVTSIMTLFGQVEIILGALIPILVTVAVVAILIGIIRYITAGEDEERRGKARNLMIYGIIGLFVMVSLWGLVEILKGTFGFSEETTSTKYLIPSDL